MIGRLALAASAVAIVGVAFAAIDIPFVAATGESSCVSSSHQQAGEHAISGGYIAGARATIEGQGLPLCTGSTIHSGSFEWVAIQNAKVAWDLTGANIVQIGYGRCPSSEINNTIGLGELCNGSYYWYWAWGTEGCSSNDGSGGPGNGPIPIRIGAALASPPSSADFYVLRHVVSGAYYYDGYVNGSLLTGLNALGQIVSARIAASRICWDSDQTDRQMAWFGETFNFGDSMGGWSGSTKDHLDYQPLRYSIGTGWVAPSLVAPNPCNGNYSTPTFSCTIAGNDHTYVDTNRPF